MLPPPAAVEFGETLGKIFRWSTALLCEKCMPTVPLIEALYPSNTIQYHAITYNAMQSSVNPICQFSQIGLWSTYNLNVPEKYMKTVSTPSIPAGTCRLFSHAAEIKREDKEMVGCKIRCTQAPQSNCLWTLGDFRLVQGPD